MIPFGVHIVRQGGRQVMTCRCDASSLVIPLPLPVQGSHCVLFCGIKPKGKSLCPPSKPA